LRNIITRIANEDSFSPLCVFKPDYNRRITRINKENNKNYNNIICKKPISIIPNITTIRGQTTVPTTENQRRVQRFEKVVESSSSNSDSRQQCFDCNSETGEEQGEGACDGKATGDDAPNGTYYHCNGSSSSQTQLGSCLLSHHNDSLHQSLLYWQDNLSTLPQVFKA
jgi:hypothetical protein